jgi:Holliday junction resolvasome RuvABC endonuclease subunit
MSVKEFDGGLLGSQKIAIGIDQSLTGFALSAVSIESPQQHKTWVYKSPYHGIQRLIDIRSWMALKFDELWLSNNEITDIAMEGTVLASHSALLLGELSALVKITIWDTFELTTVPITPLQIPPMTLKKYATGKGTSKKQEMLLQIYKRWGIEFNDDNAADAYALGRLATGASIDEVEQKVIEQIKDPKYRDSLSL